MTNLLAKMGRLLAPKQGVKAVIFGGFFAFSLAANAEMPAQPKPLWTQESSAVEVADEARRDPNKYCVQCHETANATGKPFHHFGKHFEKGVKSPNSGEPITCVSCHGNISEDHRKGVKDVMRFHARGQAVNPDLARSVNEQNQVCMACHSPEKLREKFWAHDTHATKLSCTSCHSLHPEKEPMKGIKEKDRIILCVDCHKDVHAEQKQAAEKAAKEE